MDAFALGATAVAGALRWHGLRDRVVPLHKQ
jgi:hypothetical protein